MTCPYSQSDQSATEEPTDKENLTYKNHLQLDTLLQRQPISNVHDEHFFITFHKAMELWFFQVISEIESIQNILTQNFRHRDFFTVNTRLHRVLQIWRLLNEQMKLFDTFSCMEFLKFRGLLSTASGFQSWQFRVIENKLGVPKENRIAHNQKSYKEVFEDEEMKIVEKSENEYSLFELVEKWLEGIASLKFDDDDEFIEVFKSSCETFCNEEKLKAEEEKCEKRKKDLLESCNRTMELFEDILNEDKYEAMRKKGQRRLSWKAMSGILMVFYYRKEVYFQQAFQMIDYILNIENEVSLWRCQHLMLVQRQLGTKTGTAGSSGYQYLRSTFSDRYKSFLDVLNLSGYLIPENFVPKLSDTTRHRFVENLLFVD